MKNKLLRHLGGALVGIGFTLGIVGINEISKLEVPEEYIKSINLESEIYVAELYSRNVDSLQSRLDFFKNSLDYQTYLQDRKTIDNSSSFPGIFFLLSGLGFHISGNWKKENRKTQN